MTMLTSAENGTLWIGVPAPQGAGIALTSAGVRLHRHGQEPELLDWTNLASVEVQALVSLWRYPRVASWVLNVVAAAMSSWSPGDADVVKVVCLRRDATTVTAEAAACYLTGYVRAEVEAVSELLHRAVRDPAVRLLLDEPAAVLGAVQRSVRTKAPLQLHGSAQRKG